MSPESSEGRERLARMEVQIRANERQIEMLGSLPLQVGVIQERLDSLRTDLHEAERERDARLDRHESAIDDRLEKLTRSFENQITSCSNEVAKLATAYSADREAKREDTKDDRTSRRAMWGLVGAAAVTGVLGLVAQIVQGFG